MLVLYAISDDLEDRVKNVISKEELISPFYAVPDAVYDNKDCFLGIISEKMPDFMTVMTDIVDGTNEFDRKKCYSITGRIDDFVNLSGVRSNYREGTKEADKERVISINLEEAEDFDGEIDERLIFYAE